MENNISVIVGMLCEKTPETLKLIQENFNVFLALSGYSIEEIMGSKNLLEALNRHVNEVLFDEIDLEYGSVIIGLAYKK